MIFVYWENIGRGFFIYAIVIDWRMGSRAYDRFEKTGPLVPFIIIVFLLHHLCVIGGYFYYCRLCSMDLGR